MTEEDGSKGQIGDSLALVLDTKEAVEPDVAVSDTLPGSGEGESATGAGVLAERKEDNGRDAAATANTADSSTGLTKRQLKKLAKKRKWEETKELRRAKTKAKRKEMKEKVKQGLVESYLTRGQKRAHSMKNSKCRVAVAVDMSFNHLMAEKDLCKCIKQIHRCYSVNRKEENPMQYYVTSFGGAAQEAIAKHQGWENWDVNFTNKAYTELKGFPKERITYLTSESENTLMELKPDNLYVIGGLVDHNSQKGLCHSLALEKGIHHAKLPIADFLDMKTRKVLTIDHVFEILLNVTKSLPWDKAMLDVIAPRKMAQPITNEGEVEKLPSESTTNS